MALVVARGVSLINKMLQDLDRRQALGAGADAGVARPTAANPQHREWFWRTVTVLLIVGVAWVLWTVYQLLPRPLVTPLAFFAAEEARSRPAPPAIKIEIPVKPPAAVAEAVTVEPPRVTAEPPRPATPPAAEPLKLAQEIETPVRSPTPAAAAKAPPETRAKPVASAPPRKASVDKRDHARTPNDTAETHFRRAALFLKHGRVAEAENQLAAALKADASHAASRQAYVALLLEQQRVDAARRTLQEALAIEAGQPAFALTLARIHMAQRDYRAAIEVLDRAGANEQNADFQAMRGAVLQRLGRDAEAIAAFQAAIRNGAQPATTWVNLAISLETAGRKAEAVATYRKALTAGPLAVEVRDYAQARARALE